MILKNILYGKQYGPIYSAFGKAALYNEIESGKDVSSEKTLRYIVDKLDDLINKNNLVQNNKQILIQRYSGVEVSCVFSNIELSAEIMKAIESYWVNNKNYTTVMLCDDTYRIEFNHPMYKKEIKEFFREFIEQMDKLYPGCSYSYRCILPYDII